MLSSEEMELLLEMNEYSGREVPYVQAPAKDPKEEPDGKEDQDGTLDQNGDNHQN